MAGVCSTWREVALATPNLCKGLLVSPSGVLGKNVEEMAREDNEAQTPAAMLDVWNLWTTLASRSSACHLVMTVCEERPWSVDLITKVLSSLPATNALTFECYKAFGCLIGSQMIWPAIRHLELAEYSLIATSLRQLFDTFPNLEVLASTPLIGIHSLLPRAPVELQVLHIKIPHGTSPELKRLLSMLPLLRELKLSSGDLVEEVEQDDTKPPPPTFTHLNLEAIILYGEDTLHLFSLMRLPSLKFLGLGSWGMRYAASAFKDILPKVFSKSSGHSVSLSGQPYASFVNTLIRSLPAQTRLHLHLDWFTTVDSNDEDADEDDQSDRDEDSITIAMNNITEIFFSDNEYSLGWLSREAPAEGGRTARVKVYMPTNAEGTNDAQEDLADELQALGYDLEVRREQDLDSMFNSSLPAMNHQWTLNGPIEH